MKPVRIYKVMTGPVVVPTDDGVEVILPPMTHTVEGCEIKYVLGIDQGFLHILDSGGSATFATPNSSVLWVTSELKPGAPCVVDTIHRGAVRSKKPPIPELP